MSITPIDAKNEIKRLEAAGYTVPKVGPEAVAQSWAEEMGSVARLDLTAAVTGYIRGDTSYWPKIGKLIALAHEARRARPLDPSRVRPLAEEYRAWENHEHDDQGSPLWPVVHHGNGRGCSQCEAGCPVCGAKMLWQPRLVVVHDEHVHEQAGIRWSGSCKAHEAMYAEAAQVGEREVRDDRRAKADDQRRQLAEAERRRVATRVGPLLELAKEAG